MSAAALALCALGVAGVLAGTARGLGGTLELSGALWRLGSWLPDLDTVAAAVCAGIVLGAALSTIVGAGVLGYTLALVSCGCAP